MKKIQSCFARNLGKNLRLCGLKPTYLFCNQIKTLHTQNKELGHNISNCLYKELNSFSFSTKLPRHKVIALPNLSPSMATVSLHFN